MDVGSSELAVIFALSLMVGVPVAGMVVWKVAVKTLKRRAKTSMERGNRIYSNWLRGLPNNERK